ncbi:hypothetical protein [Nocardioides bruguierae]|uniref:hypothetical protein n=1 Tax=Nocardioides bruguierae TaxID=2945102 RepID=UPI002020EF6F|nr:hypothetical protein [Nocardioides bruguierae]MCL8023899.1 hypothetical protein [Nocardioides bruguierae]
MSSSPTAADPLGASFAQTARRRPVAVVSPDAVQVRLAEASGRETVEHALPQEVACTAVQVALPAWGRGRVDLELASGDGAVRLVGVVEDGRCRLEVTGPGGTTTHASRRGGDAGSPVALALTLTGTQVTLLTRGGTGEDWTGRARVDLRELGRSVPGGARLVRDPAWLAGLLLRHRGDVRDLLAGRFGQLGLRDLRLVTTAAGDAWTDPAQPGARWFTATSAGPGFFATAHTSVWRLDLEDLLLTHTGDLFFVREGRQDPATGGPGVYGDHATHLVRDGDSWLVTTSTWGDFDPDEKDARVGVVLARTEADVTSGLHVLAARPLALPTDGLRSVAVWDSHLVREDDGTWLVGYVSARKFFEFCPVVAQGPSLDDLSLRAAATDRRATEGTTLLRTASGWRVLASDGRDNPRGLRERYPVWDLDLTEVGTLDAPYPTNLPWPTLVPDEDGGWLVVTFNGTPAGGRVLGYGTHGEVLVLSTRPTR